MKVIEVTGEPILHGGQEIFIESLLKGMNDSEMTIDILTPYEVDNEYFCQLAEAQGGNVYTLGYEFEPGRSRRFLMEPLRRFFEKHNYDLAHIHSGSISYLAYAAEAAKKAGIKKIIVHSHATGINNLKHKTVRILYSPAIKKNATNFWACSNEAGEDKYPKSIVKNQLVVIPNGIDIDDYKRDEERRVSIRKKLGISDKSFVIGHVGRFSEHKNQQYLIQLLSEMKKRLPNSKLLFVGDGEKKAEIQQEVKDIGLIDSVIFTGSVDDVANYYQAMDAFVFPSLFEGFGYAVLEAQAAGIPCVVSTGVPESAVIGKNIKRISLDDFEAWVDAVSGFNCDEIIDNGKAIEEAGYSISNTTDLVKKLYFE